MTRTTNIKNYIKIISLFGLFAFIISYSVMKTLPLLRGVELSLTGIKDGGTVSSNMLALAGRALHAKHLRINGHEILINEKSEFSENIFLLPGYNIVTVDAEDRFDKKLNRSYQILYEPPDEMTKIETNTNI